MILTDKEIRERCEPSVQKPLISPFIEEHLQGASYDISMSDTIHIFKDSVKTIRLSDQDALNDLYEEVIIKNTPFVLRPQEYVLVTINERISIPTNMVAHIRPRTKFTRLGIIISDQHCNPGYEGVLQLGLRNVSPNAIELYPDLQIAQIIFEQLTSETSKPYNSKATSTYQGESSFIGARFGKHEFSPQAQDLYNKLLSGNFSNE